MDKYAKRGGPLPTDQLIRKAFFNGFYGRPMEVPGIVPVETLASLEQAFTAGQERAKCDPNVYPRPVPDPFSNE